MHIDTLSYGRKCTTKYMIQVPLIAPVWAGRRFFRLCSFHLDGFETLILLIMCFFPYSSLDKIEHRTIWKIKLFRTQFSHPRPTKSLCRGAWLLLDTCMWCWQDESDTSGKICRALQYANTWKCKCIATFFPYINVRACKFRISFGCVECHLKKCAFEAWLKWQEVRLRMGEVPS